MVDSRRFDAVLFDLDGVLTDTASLHARCWKRVFDELLESRANSQGEEFLPFDMSADYRRYVDGKPRQDGIRDFLLSRGIRLPEGVPASPADFASVQGIAQLKDRCFSRLLENEGAKVYENAVAWVRHLRTAGMRTAVVSASHHCAAVLQAAGIADLFDARVDGQVRDLLGLAGKPEPDTFLEAAHRLETTPARCVVVEDALAGVRAGHAGNFGLVLAVARHGNRNELANAGADLVVEHLGVMLP